LKSSWDPQLPIHSIWFLIPGILVALDLRLHPRWVAALAVAMGLLQGLFNGAAVKDVRSGALELFGVAVTIFVLVALVEGFVVSLQRPWTRIVVRVAGSWIAAMGLLLLGWSLHGRL
jgi:hydrogenase/urease accessory protein HupE